MLPETFLVGASVVVISQRPYSNFLFLFPN